MIFIALTVLAHRLPIERRRGAWVTSPGGLVAALAPVIAGGEVRWIGWPGVSELSLAPFHSGGIYAVPVALSAGEVEDHYHGMCNGTLWPLFHDRVRLPQFHRHWWRAYRTANARFAAAAVDAAGGTPIWVHDYQLALAPALIRARAPSARIGYFLHIPFPPPQILAQLPWRRELLQGMLGADALAFQTPEDVAHFRAAAVRYGGAVVAGDNLRFGERQVRTDAFPIGIDHAAFIATARAPAVADEAAALRARLDGRRILLGVDRLDYTKGIRARLTAFETLIERRPSTAEDTVFLQVAVPSREAAHGYAETRNEIERLVGHLNGRFGTFGRVPVQYHYGSLDRPALVAHYRAADVMVVTPPRDGMNLVALEFVACRVRNRGALILSEFAGAAKLLQPALRVNPYDVDGIADAYEQALSMPIEEQRRRMRLMRSQVRRHDVHRWARRAVAAFAGNMEPVVPSDAR